MNEQPKVSIITVCFNSAKTIRDTIESVINQTYLDIEYIIVDGGSSDGTVDIIKEYEPHIAKWVSEPDDGIYDAMNKGIRMATGEIIGIINSDDWYHLSAVETVVRAMDSKNTVVYGKSCMVDDLHRIAYEVGGPIKQIPSYRMVIPHTAMFVHRNLYDTYGLYIEKYKIAADHEFILRLQVQNVRFYHIDKVISFVRAGGISGTQFYKTFYETFLINRKYGQKYIQALLGYVCSICVTSVVYIGLQNSFLAKQYEKYKRKK